MLRAKEEAGPSVGIEPEPRAAEPPEAVHKHRWSAAVEQVGSVPDAGTHEWWNTCLREAKILGDAGIANAGAGGEVKAAKCEALTHVEVPDIHHEIVREVNGILKAKRVVREVRNSATARSPERGAHQ